MTLMLKVPTLILGACSAASGFAQAPASAKIPLQDAPAHTVLVDDDDGKVEIVPPAGIQAPSAARTFHGGALLAAPRVSTLYMGNAWMGRQDTLWKLQSGLVAFGVSERFAALKPQGLSVFSFTVVNEGIAPAAAVPSISDLGIQHFLHGALGGGRLASPAEHSVTVLFLAPGLQSTLNGKTSGDAFLAYHSWYQDQTGRVRYVVVPFGASVEATQEAAERALTQAILNPDGTGWY
jgi:hypothetical protein